MEAAIATPPPQPTPQAPAPTPMSAVHPPAGEDAFSALENLSTVPEPKPDEGTPDEAPTPEPQKKSGPSTPKPAEKPVDPPKPESDKATPPADPDLSKMAPKQLREAAVNQRKQIAALTKQVEELKSKPAPDEKGLKDLQESRAALEKQVAEMKEELGFASFEKSDDYKDKYERPYNRAWQMGQGMMAQMKITDENGASRKATAEDWNNLMRMRQSDPDAAAEKMAEMFGNRAGLISPYMQRVDEALQNIIEARTDWQKTATERTGQRADQVKKHQEMVSKEVADLWKTHVETPIQKYPQYFAPVDGDEKGNELLAKGYEYVNEAFKSFDVMNPKLTQEQRADMVRRHAVVRNKAAAFDRLAHRSSLLSSELKAVKAKLAEFESTVPAGSAGKRGAQPAGEDSMEAAMDRAFARRR